MIVVSIFTWNLFFTSDILAHMTIICYKLYEVIGKKNDFCCILWIERKKCMIAVVFFAIAYGVFTLGTRVYESAGN